MRDCRPLIGNHFQLLSAMPARILITMVAVICTVCGRAESRTARPAEMQLSDIRKLQTSVKCSEASDWFTRNCTLRNVVVWRNNMYLLVEDPAKATADQLLPPTNIKQHRPGHNFTRFTYTTPSALVALIEDTTPRPYIRNVKYGLIWSKWLWEVYHVFAEAIHQFAMRLCLFYQLCDYNPSLLSQTQLILEEGKFDMGLPAVGQQLACFTSNPPLLLGVDADAYDLSLVVLECVVVGFGGLEFPVWTDAHDRRPSMPLETIASLRNTLLECLNVPPSPDFAPAIHPPVVTFLQRKARSRRSFLNLPEVLEELEKEMPGVKFQVVIAEGKDSAYIARAYRDTSVLVEFHGAAMVHLGLLPRQAAVVDINPPVFGPGDAGAWHNLVQRMVRSYSQANNLTFVPIEISGTDSVAMYQKRVISDPVWKQLPAEKKVEIFETGLCAEELRALPDAWGRCRNNWLSRDIMGVILDTAQMVEALRKALGAVAAAGEGVQQSGGEQPGSAREKPQRVKRGRWFELDSIAASSSSTESS